MPLRIINGQPHRGFYPYQSRFAKRVIRSVIEKDGEEITALFSRQSGKSEAISSVTGGMMIILPILANLPMFADDQRLIRFKEGLWVGIFAPIQNQAQITFNRIRDRLSGPGARALFADIYNEWGVEVSYEANNGVNVILSNGSRVKCQSASEGSNIEGETFHLIIIEECQDVSDYKIRKSIHPMGAATKATIVKIGTPSTRKGEFYEAIQRNKKLWEEGKLRYSNHFEFNYLEVSKYNPDYADYIEKEKFRLGEDSDEFQMAYNLKWILERSMFITEEILREKVYDETLDLVPFDHERVHVAGIDFGKINDPTVVTIGEVDWENPIIVEPPKNLENLRNVDAVNYGYIAYNVKVKNWLELKGDDYEAQYQEIMEFFGNYNLARVVCDYTGQGIPITDRLAANLSCEVVPYAFSTPSKSVLYKHLSQELKGGRVKVPASESARQTIEWRSFDRQMLELQKSYSGSHLIVSHPDGRDAHDDYCDSLALMVYGCRTEGLAEIEVKLNPFKVTTTSMKRFYKARNAITARRR